MKALFYSYKSGKICFALVREKAGRLLIDRPTLRRTLRRLDCTSPNDLACNLLVFYSYPTIGRPNKEYKRFNAFVLQEVE